MAAGARVCPGSRGHVRARQQGIINIQTRPAE